MASSGFIHEDVIGFVFLQSLAHILVSLNLHVDRFKVIANLFREFFVVDEQGRGVLVQ